MPRKTGSISIVTTSLHNNTLSIVDMYSILLECENEYQHLDAHNLVFLYLRKLMSQTRHQSDMKICVDKLCLLFSESVFYVLGLSLKEHALTSSLFDQG